MKHFVVTDHDGEPPDARVIAVDTSDPGKRELLAELADVVEMYDAACALAIMRPGFWSRLRVWWWRRKFERAKAALADAPGGHRCKP